MFLRKRTRRFYYSFPRRRWVAVSVCAVLSSPLLLYALTPLTETTPPPSSSSLYHYWRNRDLHTYLDVIDVLVEAGGGRCSEPRSVPVVALVTSAPSRRSQRQAIRETWGQRVPVYFFLGLETKLQVHLVDNYVESKQFEDLVVFELSDSYSNLTLKTALMLQWARRRCPHARFFFKTDDDVMVNPWTLANVVNEHQDDAIIGYRLTGDSPHRNPNKKWYLPTWLYPQTHIPEFLVGTGYLINAGYLSDICQAAYSVPLINLEDVYWSLLVARQRLGLTLTHEPRLSPAQPLFTFACTYWDYASVHSLTADSMYSVWNKIEPLGTHFENGEAVCTFYRRYFAVFSSDALAYRPIIF